MAIDKNQEVRVVLGKSDAIDRIGLSSDSSDADDEYLAGVGNSQHKAEQTVATDKTLAVLSALAGVDIGAARRLRETLTSLDLSWCTSLKGE